jgi:hypothetical protein
MVSRLLCSKVSVVNRTQNEEENPMTPQLIQPEHDMNNVELDQLTYSAYLLMLDPGLALSVVMAAIERSMQDAASRADLLQCTIEMSLAQLRLRAGAESDRQSGALETLLYGDSSFAASKWAVSLKKQTDDSPILLLGLRARIAFVLHHVLGYSIQRGAAMVQISEKEYHTRLRNAYVQLAAPELGASAIAGYMVDPTTPAKGGM